MPAPASHHLFYGQSKSVGTQAFNASGAVKSITPLSGAVRFNQGICAWQEFQGADPRANNTTDALKRASFVDMIEEKVGSDGETGVYGFCEAYRYMLSTHKGIASTGDFKLIGSSAGNGNRTAAQLSKGGTIYPRILADIQYGRMRAIAGTFPDGVNRRYALESITYDQGEDDASIGTSKATWKATVEQIKADIEDDAETLTGIARSIPMFIPQLASHANTGNNFAIAEAQAELGIADGNGIYCPTPLYPFYYKDSVHFTDVGAYERGLYCGVAAYYVIEEGRDWKPVHPVEYQIDDVFLRVQFAGGNLGNGGRLVFSNPAYCPQATNNGFVLRKPDGSVNDYRSAVCLGEWVEFRFDGAVASGSTLKAGVEGTGVGPNGPRINLRDNAGDGLTIGGRPMHNWSLMFQLPIT